MNTNLVYILMCFSPMAIGGILFFVIDPIIRKIQGDRMILKAYKNGELEWTESYDEYEDFQKTIGRVIQAPFLFVLIFQEVSELWQ